MTSKSYKIHRWDAVLFGSNVNPKPVIYVKPDDLLLKYVCENKKISVKINVPGDNRYGCKTLSGLFLTNPINPNYCMKTGLYVIVLNVSWYGYPNDLGTCEIFNIGNDKR